MPASSHGNVITCVIDDEKLQAIQAAYLQAAQQLRTLSVELDTKTEEVSVSEAKLRQAADYGTALLAQLRNQRYVLV